MGRFLRHADARLRHGAGHRHLLLWIASDDNSELWLSTDTSPANATEIAYVPGWTSSRAYTWYSQQKSAAISLVAGQSYYIEALQKEGGGGDNLSVAWRLPTDTADPTVPIAGTYLSPFTVNPDKTLGIAVTDPTCSETGPDKGTFTITRTGNTADAITVYYTVTGTASTYDYQETLTQSIQMAAGVASVTIDITPVYDRIVEGNETVILTLVSDKA